MMSPIQKDNCFNTSVYLLMNVSKLLSDFSQNEIHIAFPFGPCMQVRRRVGFWQGIWNEKMWGHPYQDRDAWERWESLVRNMWQSPRDDFKDHLHGECRTKFLEDNVSKELEMFHLEKHKG